MVAYTQTISDNKIIREFSPDVDEQELKWHYDLKDRFVEVIENSGWKFQFDDELPILLEDSIFIKSGRYHRVIKGDGKLIVEIIEN